MAHRLLDARLDEGFALYDELAASLAGEQLGQRLPVPSNPLGMQLWCVIGARETWARAIGTGTWGPFRCSITDPVDTTRPGVLAEALRSSGEAFRTVSGLAPQDDVRMELKLKLLEHESQHQGQILRYLLGLRLEVPPGWRRRFAL